MILKISQKEYYVDNKYIIVEPSEKFYEIIEYLQADDEFWLKDLWDAESEIFKNYGIEFKRITVKYITKLGEEKSYKCKNHFDFSYIENENLKLELKYWYAKNLIEKEIKATNLLRVYQPITKHLVNFIVAKDRIVNSFKNIEIKKIEWINYLRKNDVENPRSNYIAVRNTIPSFFKYYYDIREEKTLQNVCPPHTSIGVD